MSAATGGAEIETPLMTGLGSGSGTARGHDLERGGGGPSSSSSSSSSGAHALSAGAPAASSAAVGLLSYGSDEAAPAMAVAEASAPLPPAARGGTAATRGGGGGGGGGAPPPDEPTDDEEQGGEEDALRARENNEGGPGSGRPLPSRRRQRRLLRLLNVSDPAVLFYAALVVNVPQIVVAGLVFGLEWTADKDVCDAASRARWRVWGAFHAARLGATTVIAGLRWRFSAQGSHPRRRRGRGQQRDEDSATRRRYSALVANARNSLDALALIWFVVGNMWLLGGGEAECDQASKSPIYVVDVAMLVVQYAQICLPCVFAIAMVPVFCFCLPCVIRLLAALHEPNAAARGASRRAISELPTVTYSRGLELGGEEPCCSVCISDFELGDQLRVLPCKHAFHATCVDQWLQVNANCPLCRKSIFLEDDHDDDDDDDPSGDDETSATTENRARGTRGGSGAAAAAAGQRGERGSDDLGPSTRPSAAASGVDPDDDDDDAPLDLPETDRERRRRARAARLQLESGTLTTRGSANAV